MDGQALARAEVFVCPRCKGALAAAAEALRCAACRLAYPVADDIPVLLVDEAMPMASGDLSSSSESLAGTTDTRIAGLWVQGCQAPSRHSEAGFQSHDLLYSHRLSPGLKV